MKNKILIIIGVLIVVVTAIVLLVLTTDDSNEKLRKGEKRIENEYILELKKDVGIDGFVPSVFPNACVKVTPIENTECVKENKNCDIDFFKVEGIEEGTTYIRFVKGLATEIATENNTITYRADVDENLNLIIKEHDFVDPYDNFSF